MTTASTGLDTVNENANTNIAETNENGDDTNTSSWLDETFVETILRQDTGDVNLSVIHIDVRDAVPSGNNFMGVLKRVCVEYRRSNDNATASRRSIVVKSLRRGEVLLTWARIMALFEKETSLYYVTLPKIHQLINERMGGENWSLTPRVFPTNRPNTIVLEDLQPLGYKMADRQRGLDLHHCIATLKSLAKLHGASVAVHAQDTSSMDVFRETLYVEEARDIQIDFLGSSLRQLAAEVGTWPGYEHYGQKLESIVDGFFDRLIEVVSNKPGVPLRVLNHGDLWTNNIMFRYDSDGALVDLKIIDFQFTRFVSPAMDLTYFFFTSPEQQVFDDHREEMLEQYHDALCDTMRRMGCDQDLFISLEQLHQDMEDKEFFAVIVSIFFGMMVSEPEDAPKLSNLSKEEMKSGKVVTMSRVFSGKRFREAMQKRLPMFHKKGLI